MMDSIAKYYNIIRAINTFVPERVVNERHFIRHYIYNGVVIVVNLLTLEVYYNSELY